MTNNGNNHKAEEEQNSIQKNLQDQFCQLKSDETPPEELKDEVFKTLDTIHLVADLIDLFTVKFGSTDAEFLDLLGTDDFFKIEE